MYGADRLGESNSFIFFKMTQKDFTGLVKRYTAYIYHGRIALSEGWQNGNIGNKRLESQQKR